jgi:hypothetical protein
MPYQLIRDAIRDEASLTGHYESYVRFFSPHALGKDSSGAAIIIAYQYGGGRRGGLPPGGDWVCFNLSGLSGVERNGDKWLACPLTARPMHFLRHVDIAA